MDGGARTIIPRRRSSSMPDIIAATSSKQQPQISDMFQKFALVLKSKTYELFSDDQPPPPRDNEDAADEIILGQRVVVLKPDSSSTNIAPPPVPPTQAQDDLAPPALQVHPDPDSPLLPRQEPELENGREFSLAGRIDLRIIETLISSVFATVSAFEASYVQLQISHSPFVEESVKSADEALVGHLQRLCRLSNLFLEYCRNPGLVNGSFDLSILSCLEARVQENQSKLRTLVMISNKLQLEMDDKDHEVVMLKNKLGDIRRCNSRLSRRLSDGIGRNREVSLSIRVFEGVLKDACRASHRFAKVLIGLMGIGGWNLSTAAQTLYSDVDFVKKGHCCYAFLSYVCLVMFRGFDSDCFGLDEDGRSRSLCNGHRERINDSLSRLLEHVSGNPMEVLSVDTGCEFARFCESKYKELINLTMESKVFGSLDGCTTVLSSWRSFVEMASSIWMLHKLAFSFDPVVEIFQVERGAEYCMVYMEDILKGYVGPCKVRPRIGFTIIPGFRIGRTVVQCKVYLSGSECQS